MNPEQLKQLQQETTDTLAEVSDLNKRIELFLGGTDEESNEYTEDAETLDQEDKKEFEGVLNELDLDLNDTLLKFAPKEQK